MVPITLPNILSFLSESGFVPSKPLNPHAAQLEEDFNKWVDKSPFPQEHQKMIKGVQMPLLTSLVYPNADLCQLDTCLKYMLLSLVLEELTDSASSLQTQKWANIFIGLLEGGEDCPEGPEVSHPMYHLMKRLSTIVMQRIDLAYRSDFVQENTLAAASIVLEACDRESSLQGNAFTIASFKATRQTTIGFKPFLVLARWVRSIDLPEDLKCYPPVRQMLDAAVDMVFIANDIYSYKKERLANAAQHNIITVIMQDPFVEQVGEGDLQASFDYAYFIFQDALSRFKQAVAHVKMKTNFRTERLDACAKESILQYAEAMMDCVIGNVKWSMVCQRYSVFDSEELRAMNVVSIPV